MEAEVGPQVAPPILYQHHRPLPGPFHEAPLLARKRALSNTSFPHSRTQESQHPQQRLMGTPLTNYGGNWNPRTWEWDSVGFTAKPSADAEVFRLRSKQSSVVTALADQRNKGDEDPKDSVLSRSVLEDENLALKLGGGSYSMEEPATRPNKKVRSGSPGSGGNYPMCQVDDCRADLSGAKDYHRRHKVCEVHSKTAKALVGKQMQRFCQQCSRFHPLSEFDEGKRSCRRRLAGHNRRRRKTQPEDASSRLLLSTNPEGAKNGNLDIVNLLAMIAQLQGSNQVKPTGASPLPGKDQLVQLISKLGASVNANALSTSSAPGDFDLNVSQIPTLGSFEQPVKAMDTENAPATNKLLSVLSAALAASDAPPSLSQGSSESSGNDKAKIHSVEPSTDINSHNKSIQSCQLTGVLRNNCSNQSRVEVFQQTVQQPRPNLPLQLFGPPHDDSPAELGSAFKYLSSESSNPMEERSPSSSPPVTKKLFPLHSTMEREKYGQVADCREDNTTVELSDSHGGCAPLELFKYSERQVDNGAVQSMLYRAAYKSSGSDQSPSSSNSDTQDRAGRIIFKLFGKDPSSFPASLRSQVLNWLSNSPSDMESYIRPGCVILSIYLSMPSVAWEELEDDLLQRVNSLVHCSDSTFWTNGRFLVRTNRQLVSHKDGKIRLSKTWGAWSAPELTSVSPVAVVSGQETSLVLKGRNLTVPGTKIHCTYMGKYMSKEVLCSAHHGTIYDDSCVERFDFPGGSPNVFGRCFIEVENGFKGNNFPVIIASDGICQELRTLESDFEDAQTDAIPEEQIHNSLQPRSKEDALHFLNELGWLFQRTHLKSSIPLLEFSSARFKYLLTFSVERDWCTLIRTLLDILVERSLKNEALKQESLEMISEVCLLNRAVKRKCKKMVELLLHYCVAPGTDASKAYIFTPNMAGPGGVTPLHMAASMQDSAEMVDALTNDPQEIGLKCWSSLLDDSGHSPYMYAVSRNNLSYNRLVARKHADTANGQVSISVEDGEISMDDPCVEEVSKRRGGLQTSQATSCSKCALAGSVRLRRPVRSRGLLQRPYVHSLLAIAAVCVCVCIFIRGCPRGGSAKPIKWEYMDFGPR